MEVDTLSFNHLKRYAQNYMHLCATYEHYLHIVNIFYSFIEVHDNPKFFNIIFMKVGLALTRTFYEFE